jgi:hypothetical protein
MSMLGIGRLGLLRSRGIMPERVLKDPQSVFCSLTTSFENVAIDVGGAQDYVPVVDAKSEGSMRWFVR